MAPDPTYTQTRRASNIRSAGSPMEGPVVRKQRAVLTCEECRRKKIRCTRNKNGLCERCKAQGIPCRPSTSESINAPRIVLPQDLDYSVVRLYHVVQDLQRRLGMPDTDLAQVIRRHCAPQPPHDLMPSTPVFSHTHSTPPSSSHDSGSSYDGQYSPFTPNDDEDLLVMRAAADRSRTHSHSPLFVTTTSSSSTAGLMAHAELTGDVVVIKNEYGPPTAFPAAGYAMPQMPIDLDDDDGERTSGYVSRSQQDWPGMVDGVPSWMLPPPQAPQAEEGVEETNDRGISPSHAAGYLVDFGRDSWSA